MFLLQLAVMSANIGMRNYYCCVLPLCAEVRVIACMLNVGSSLLSQLESSHRLRNTKTLLILLKSSFRMLVNSLQV